MRKGQIRVSCGIGDVVTYLARIENFRKTNDLDHVHIHVAGGWKHIPHAILNIGEVCVNHKLIDSITFSPIQDADVSEDWQPDENPLKYQIKLPFLMPSNSSYSFRDSDEYTHGRDICIIHPVTSVGSFEGFNQNRYLPKEDWSKICTLLHELKYFIVMIGSQEDDGYLTPNMVDLNLCGLLSYDETFSVLKTADLVVGTNSWPWEISAYANVPTVCLYYTNTHWIRLHTPTDSAPSHGMHNLRIETEKNVEKILEYIREFHGNKRNS